MYNNLLYKGGTPPPLYNNKGGVIVAWPATRGVAGSPLLTGPMMRSPMIAGYDGATSWFWASPRIPGESLGPLWALL